MSKYSQLPLTLGWGDGITGPTTPRTGGPTCGDMNREDIDRIHYHIISKDKATIAIFPDQIDGVMGKANAEMFFSRVNNHDKLVEALKLIKGHLGNLSQNGNFNDLPEWSRPPLIAIFATLADLEIK